MISVRAYAKHRGCSAAAVSKAIKVGRLRASIARDKLGHPKIADVAAADAEWARNTLQRAETPNSKPAKKSKAPAATHAAAPLPPGVPSYNESRARNEAAKSGLLTLQLLEAKGRLVSVDGVRDAIAMKFSEVRSKLMGVPHRMRQRSSTITAKDLSLVDQLIREALEALADDLSTD